MNQHRHARAMVIVREAHFGSVLAMWSLHLLTHNFLCQALESFTWEIPGLGRVLYLACFENTRFR